MDVYWFIVFPNGTEDELGMWMTDDPNVKPDRHYYREDCRKVSILAYKPRRVQIFFDGEPDEWNEWR
jgi:hypothetical protein